MMCSCILNIIVHRVLMNMNSMLKWCSSFLFPKIDIDMNTGVA